MHSKKGKTMRQTEAKLTNVNTSKQRKQDKNAFVKSYKSVVSCRE